MVTELFFDVETKKLFSDIASDDPADLGVSIVSVYKRQLNEALEETQGELRSFWEKDFPSMWQWFSEADRIVGFNSLKFDVPALRPYAPENFSRLPHFDVMELVRQKLGRRIGLNALAQVSLGIEKIDHGTNAVIYWAKGDAENLKKLQTYCESDVLLTRDLYEYGKKFGHLKYMDKWNRESTIEIDFSYPKKEVSPQIGLF